MYTILALLLMYLGGSAQHCTVDYYPSESIVSYDCRGNDHTRVLIYIDTTITKIPDITSIFGDKVEFKATFEYNTTLILETIIKYPSFSIRFGYSEGTDLKSAYTFDPENRHRTLLTIYDKSAL
jgi:hypothetical protein